MNGLHLPIALAMAVSPAFAAIADDTVGDRLQVDVILVEPGNFTDLAPMYLAGQIRDYVQRRATQYLAEDQALMVTINDVDMAGGFEAWHGPEYHNVRVMRDVYPPRIDLSFELTDENGAVLANGERRLRDLSYLMRVRPKIDPDQLAYEKQLLDEWLREEFR